MASKESLKFYRNEGRLFLNIGNGEFLCVGIENEVVKMTQIQFADRVLKSIAIAAFNLMPVGRQIFH